MIYGEFKNALIYNVNYNSWMKIPEIELGIEIQIRTQSIIYNEKTGMLIFIGTNPSIYKQNFKMTIVISSCQFKKYNASKTTVIFKVCAK